MSDSIGARLRQARELRRLTVEQASEATKLRTHYLQALENDDFSAIPSAAQARGFLRLYAEFLELDVAALVPAVPVQPATAVPIAATPKAATKVASASPAPSNFLTALLKRFSPSKKTEPAQEPPASAAASPAPEPPPDAAAPAASEAQTARRPRPDPTEVKKNALGK